VTIESKDKVFSVVELERLIGMRIRYGIRLYDVATVLGRTTNTVTRWEKSSDVALVPFMTWMVYQGAIESLIDKALLIEAQRAEGARTAEEGVAILIGRRRRLGISQRDMGKMVSVSAATISNMETEIVPGKGELWDRYRKELAAAAA